MSLLDIINITKSSDIPAIVKALSLDEQDMLMKYIYKGLASPDLGASAILLGWHEKVNTISTDNGIDRKTDIPSVYS